MADFEGLKVWQAAHALVLDAYRITASFPRAEQFGLTSQIRRAAVSVAANIAESTGRNHSLDQARFLQIAMGSAKEVRCHFLIARDLGFLSPTDQQAADTRLAGIERMLSSLLRYHKGRG
ncbi:MAG: four helix bundle protein [Gemmatimonadales bacterium]